MFVHYQTQGFILKKIDRGEADRVFTIYTKDFGKLELLAKAERKIKSKLRGGLELFYLSEIEFIQGKTYKTLTDAILIDNFKNLRKDLKRLAIAYQISAVLDQLVKGEAPEERIWQLLGESFEKLNNWIPSLHHPLEIIYYYFFWNLVSILGYQPELNQESLCGKKIDLDLAKILKLILRKDWPILSRLKIDSSHLQLLKNISEWYNTKKVMQYAA